MKNILKSVVLALGFMTMISCQAQNQSTMVNGEEVNLEEGMYAKVTTNKGDILLALEFEKTPMTVANFVGLAEGAIENTHKAAGEPYYDGIKFHRVIADFMIQGGDPQGTGSGGPGYNFPDEFDPSLRHDTSGILSMANAGPGTNGSQFFITHKETPWLDDKHSVFGHVVEGQDVVDAIAQNDVMETVEILRIGSAAEAFDAPGTFAAKQEEIVAEAAAAAEKAQADFEAWLNDEYPNRETTESGLMYVITEQGDGPAPEQGDSINVQYVGKFIDGKVFDTSWEQVAKDNNIYNPQRPYAPLPLTCGVGQVIPGWDEGLQLLNQGGSATLIIPPHLAYGERGYPGFIPPNSTLVFDVTLVNVVNK